MGGHLTKWEEDNRAPLNPAAIVAALALGLFVVGLGFLFALT